LATVYASKFRQLTYDVNWGEAALIDQFRCGLHDDVQDLLLTLADPSSFSEVKTKQFNVTIVCSNVAKKKKSPPTPSFGTVALLCSP
jgi:hypothetical protein